MHVDMTLWHLEDPGSIERLLLPPLSEINGGIKVINSRIDQIQVAKQG